MLRCAKIMPTLGPSSWDEATIEALVQAGAAAFRLNFSHGDEARHRQTVANIRAVAAKMAKHIMILQDLQGPKIRIGSMAEPVRLTVGMAFTIDSDPTPGTSERVGLPHPEIMAALRVGDRISLNDGVIGLKVVAVREGAVDTIVEASGVLSSCKGVNVPGRELPLEVLTPKDLADLKVGMDMGVDWVALSFVQKAADIEEAKALVAGRALVMAKIETQAAVDNLEAIIEVSDGIMIARGDLGVELAAEEVPPLQRKMISLCRAAGKPVVVATQMLESMIENPVPTRAEASDVATAAYEGADCLMLSAESASGKHPVEAVNVMARIIAKVEESASWAAHVGVYTPVSGEPAVRDAVCEAACQVAMDLDAACVVGFTETGNTVLRLARWRPHVPVVCLTEHAKIARQMAIVWGTRSLLLDHKVENVDDMVVSMEKAVIKAGLATKGDRVVIAAGVPFGQSGKTNVLRVTEIGG